QWHLVRTEPAGRRGEQNLTGRERRLRGQRGDHREQRCHGRISRQQRQCRDRQENAHALRPDAAGDSLPHHRVCSLTSGFAHPGVGAPRCVDAYPAGCPDSTTAGVPSGTPAVTCGSSAVLRRLLRELALVTGVGGGLLCLLLTTLLAVLLLLRLRATEALRLAVAGLAELLRLAARRDLDDLLGDQVGGDGTERLQDADDQDQDAACLQARPLERREQQGERGRQR